MNKVINANAFLFSFPNEDDDSVVLTIYDSNIKGFSGRVSPDEFDKARFTELSDADIYEIKLSKVAWMALLEDLEEAKHDQW